MQTTSKKFDHQLIADQSNERLAAAAIWRPILSSWQHAVSVLFLTNRKRTVAISLKRHLVGAALKDPWMQNSLSYIYVDTLTVDYLVNIKTSIT
jgi:hypothetical protein